jgi:citrate synthase
MRNHLTANQVATRLGVQLKTVYAYVSRGVLNRTLADDARTSLFDTGEVDRLARRGRPRHGSRPLGGVDVSLATSITCIEAERLLFRGHDVRTLVTLPFEAVAELLWSGQLPERAAWPVGSDKELRALSFGLPATSPATERLAAVTAALACKQPLRVDLRPAAVMQHARTLLVTMVDCLPLLARQSGKRKRSEESLAARLWPRLSALPPTSVRVECLNAALVLLADHELATSTFAARVAASTRADPFAVVLAGLGAVSGPLHGKAALAAHELLLTAQSSGLPERAVANVISRVGAVPGFGHPVYRGVDPRAQCLLTSLAPLLKRADAAVIDAVTSAATATSQLQPNIDFALACLAFALDMPAGATEAVFVVARTAGWVAHALEEYGERPLRFRARALYIGPTAPG